MSLVKKVCNLIILDESGSMASLQQATMSTFNELIQSISADAAKAGEREQWIQFYSFNGNGIKEQIPLQKVSELMQLNENNYRPDSMTPLFDAIGHATGKLRYALEGETGYIVLVTILTDGAENASKEFTATTIANIIKELQNQNWVFTYIGTNQDVAKEAARMNIVNHARYENNGLSLKSMMVKERSAREKFYTKLDNKDFNTGDKYFDDESKP
ncbi:vWA domain-containing protein [Flavihumibacter profundi]|uniref:vWA domain-containing protein n=1 Tax=Flavihumibacter profundi TaxID=2716883 RepID=UPI001CC3C0BD|nr:vWA domain-containing protein [Flavihumibacter profundi]MBZ5857548.1 VWA domain-containing protein [Flavihumibacter profundi]